jgi:hypothetical protein
MRKVLGARKMLTCVFHEKIGVARPPQGAGWENDPPFSSIKVTCLGESGKSPPIAKHLYGAGQAYDVTTSKAHEYAQASQGQAARAYDTIAAKSQHAQCQ